MYFPYLRGKQFELEALLEVPFGVYQNILPIIEPVNIPRRGFYLSLANRGVPMILITNPFHPQNSRLLSSQIQSLISGDLSSLSTLYLGFIIDARFNIADLQTFLSTNTTHAKVLLFHYSPILADLNAINSELLTYPVDYIIFDEGKTNIPTYNAFSTHPNRVLLTDGFQRQSKNANYPSVSSFDSRYNTWRTNGWVGIGDYLTVGNHFQDGGGQGYVVTLHITVQTPSELQVRHFSSTSFPTTQGIIPTKFLEANRLLVTSPIVVPLRSNGVNYYRDWHNRLHNPHLGAAKKASMIHHIELMSSII